jgi:hypothetical protein
MADDTQPSPLTVKFSGDVPASLAIELLKALDDYYRSLGGDGLMCVHPIRIDGTTYPANTSISDLPDPSTVSDGPKPDDLEDRVRRIEGWIAERDESWQGHRLP